MVVRIGRLIVEDALGLVCRTYSQLLCEKFHLVLNVGFTMRKPAASIIPYMIGPASQNSIVETTYEELTKSN